MSKKKSKSKKKSEDLHVDENLEGLKIDINSLGEIQSNYDIDKINDFLDEKVKDKKLTGNEKRLTDDEKD